MDQVLDPASLTRESGIKLGSSPGMLLILFKGPDGFWSGFGVGIWKGLLGGGSLEGF